MPVLPCCRPASPLCPFSGPACSSGPSIHLKSPQTTRRLDTPEDGLCDPCPGSGCSPLARPGLGSQVSVCVCLGAMSRATHPFPSQEPVRLHVRAGMAWPLRDGGEGHEIGGSTATKRRSHSVIVDGPWADGPWSMTNGVSPRLLSPNPAGRAFSGAVGLSLRSSSTLTKKR
jgi:hypothetical protein